MGALMTERMLDVVAAGAPVAAAQTDEGILDKWLIPTVVALLGSSVVAGLIGTVLANLRATAAVRRDRYALAVRALIARVEYPYRIRRRTGDDPATLAALAERGNDLQERLAESRAWVAAENRVLAEVYNECLAAVDAPVKRACTAAWTAGPVTSAAGMNLVGFGPGDQQAIVSRLECAIAYRFGWRRLLPAAILRTRLRRRCLLGIAAPTSS
jgi:hypothetical protein